MAKPRKRTPQPSPSLPGHGDHSRHAARRLTLAGVGIAVVFAGGWLLRRGPEKTSRLASDTPARTPLPEDERTVFAQYGGSASCRECHQEAFDLQGVIKGSEMTNGMIVAAGSKDYTESQP